MLKVMKTEIESDKIYLENERREKERKREKGKK